MSNEDPFTLKIFLHSAENVPVADFTKSDPYFKIFLSSKRIATTKVIHRNLNPVWDETFPVKLPTTHCEIKFELYDEDPSQNDDFLGDFSIDLSQLQSGKQRYELKKANLNQNFAVKTARKGAQVLGLAPNPKLPCYVYVTMELKKSQYIELSSPIAVHSENALPSALTNHFSEKNWSSFSQATKKLIGEFLQRHEKSIGTPELYNILDCVYDTLQSQANFKNYWFNNTVKRTNFPTYSASKIHFQKDGSLSYEEHSPIEANSFQINFNSSGTEFSLFTFHSHYELWTWWKWFVGAFQFWAVDSNEPPDWMTDYKFTLPVSVRSHEYPETKRLFLQVNLDFPNSIGISERMEYFETFLHIENISSVILSEDSRCPTNRIMELQLTDNLDEEDEEINIGKITTPDHFFIQTSKCDSCIYDYENRDPIYFDADTSADIESLQISQFVLQKNSVKISAQDLIQFQKNENVKFLQMNKLIEYSVEQMTVHQLALDIKPSTTLTAKFTLANNHGICEEDNARIKQIPLNIYNKSGDANLVNQATLGGSGFSDNIHYIKIDIIANHSVQCGIVFVPLSAFQLEPLEITYSITRSSDTSSEVIQFAASRSNEETGYGYTEIKLRKIIHQSIRNAAQIPLVLSRKFFNSTLYNTSYPGEALPLNSFSPVDTVLVSILPQMLQLVEFSPLNSKNPRVSLSSTSDIRSSHINDDEEEKIERIEVFENQSRLLNWGPPSSQYPRYSDLKLKKAFLFTSLKNNNIPLPENCHWISDWEIDKSFTETDQEGWSYAKNYQQWYENYSKRKSNSSPFNTFVRRRKWVRSYTKVVDNSSKQKEKVNLFENMSLKKPKNSIPELSWRKLLNSNPNIGYLATCQEKASFDSPINIPWENVVDAAVVTDSILGITFKIHRYFPPALDPSASTIVSTLSNAIPLPGLNTVVNEENSNTKETFREVEMEIFITNCCAEELKLLIFNRMEFNDLKKSNLSHFHMNNEISLKSEQDEGEEHQKKKNLSKLQLEIQFISEFKQLLKLRNQENQIYHDLLIKYHQSRYVQYYLYRVFRMDLYLFNLIHDSEIIATNLQLFNEIYLEKEFSSFILNEIKNALNVVYFEHNPNHNSFSGGNYSNVPLEVRVDALVELLEDWICRLILNFFSRSAIIASKHQQQSSSSSSSSQQQQQMEQHQLHRQFISNLTLLLNSILTEIRNQFGIFLILFQENMKKKTVIGIGKSLLITFLTTDSSLQKIIEKYFNFFQIQLINENSLRLFSFINFEEIANCYISSIIDELKTDVKKTVDSHRRIYLESQNTTPAATTSTHSKPASSSTFGFYSPKEPSPNSLSSSSNHPTGLLATTSIDNNSNSMKKKISFPWKIEQHDALDYFFSFIPADALLYLKTGKKTVDLLIQEENFLSQNDKNTKVNNNNNQSSSSSSHVQVKIQLINEMKNKTYLAYTDALLTLSKEYYQVLKIDYLIYSLDETNEITESLQFFASIINDCSMIIHDFQNPDISNFLNDEAFFHRNESMKTLNENYSNIINTTIDYISCLIYILAFENQIYLFSNIPLSTNHQYPIPQIQQQENIFYEWISSMNTNGSLFHHSDQDLLKPIPIDNLNDDDDNNNIENNWFWEFFSKGIAGNLNDTRPYLKDFSNFKLLQDVVIGKYLVFFLSLLSFMNKNKSLINSKIILAYCNEAENLGNQFHILLSQSHQQQSSQKQHSHYHYHRQYRNTSRHSSHTSRHFSHRSLRNLTHFDDSLEKFDENDEEEEQRKEFLRYHSNYDGKDFDDGKNYHSPISTLSCNLLFTLKSLLFEEFNNDKFLYALNLFSMIYQKEAFDYLQFSMISFLETVLSIREHLISMKKQDYHSLDKPLETKEQLQDLLRKTSGSMSDIPRDPMKTIRIPLISFNSAILRAFPSKELFLRLQDVLSSTQSHSPFNPKLMSDSGTTLFSLRDDLLFSAIPHEKRNKAALLLFPQLDQPLTASQSTPNATNFTSFLLGGSSNGNLTTQPLPSAGSTGVLMKKNSTEYNPSILPPAPSNSQMTSSTSTTTTTSSSISRFLPSFPPIPPTLFALRQQYHSSSSIHSHDSSYSALDNTTSNSLPFPLVRSVSQRSFSKQRLLQKSFTKLPLKDIKEHNPPISTENTADLCFVLTKFQIMNLFHLGIGRNRFYFVIQNEKFYTKTSIRSGSKEISWDTNEKNEPPIFIPIFTTQMLEKNIQSEISFNIYLIGIGRYQDYVIGGINFSFPYYHMIEINHDESHDLIFSTDSLIQDAINFTKNDQRKLPTISFNLSKVQL